VRDELPDVQLRRPEVSSALAAVVDRATTKDVERRYADSRELIDDLEDVLAIETARSGQATGEATAVIRTLPSNARRRLPLRVRHGWRWLAGILVLGALVAAVALYSLADRTERGAQGTRNVQAAPGTKALSLAQANARDYDPVGGDGEHPDEAKFVVDGENSTTWSTEAYQGATLNGKPGVGIYVIASPAVAARVIDVNTPTPGWEGGIYTSRGVNGVPKDIKSWTELAKITRAKARNRIDLDTAGNPYRYYLVWITKLPPAVDRVKLSEIRLYR
jgi:serine/threonine-protein kinase